MRERTGAVVRAKEPGAGRREEGGEGKRLAGAGAPIEDGACRGGLENTHVRALGRGREEREKVAKIDLPARSIKWEARRGKRDGAGEADPRV